MVVRRGERYLEAIGLMDTPREAANSAIAKLRDISVVRMLISGYNENVAEAIAHATVCIAMGVAGTDVTLETADIALVADELVATLSFAVGLTSATSRIIRKNLWASLGIVALLIGPHCSAMVLGLLFSSTKARP